MATGQWEAETSCKNYFVGILITQIEKKNKKKGIGCLFLAFYLCFTFCTVDYLLSKYQVAG